MSRNLQKEVTPRILAKLKEGGIPWQQPWTGNAFKSEAKLVCAKCRYGPLAGVALYRDKGALFYSGRGIRGKGHLYCLEHAPSAIAKKACELAYRLDPAERGRLSRNEFVQAQLRPKLEAA